VSKQVPELRTQRLRMRAWTATDRDDFAEMNADPEVMEHLSSTLTREQSDAFVDRIEQAFVERGWGLWALEADGSFLGFTGLWPADFHAPFMDGLEPPVVEVGWRLRRSAWGHGYATEAAREAIRFGFEELRLPQIVSFTTVDNVRSRAVMQRLGMTLLTTYDHPIPDREPLPSVCYLLRR
jgi:RimJ/RimL family protein N-acetyltransferase